jgi:hypothetical protein
MFASTRIALLALFAATVAVAADSAVVSSPADRLEDAARRFRLQVYRTYRLDRAEYDRRRTAWETLQAQWRAAGSPERYVPELIEWLELAEYRSRPDVRSDLPVFRTRQAPAEPAPKRSTVKRPVDSGRPVPRQPIAQVPHSDPPIRPAGPRPSLPLSPAATHDVLIGPSPAASARSSSAHRPSPGTVAEPKPSLGPEVIAPSPQRAELLAQPPSGGIESPNRPIAAPANGFSHAVSGPQIDRDLAEPTVNDREPLPNDQRPATNALRRPVDLSQPHAPSPTSPRVPRRVTDPARPTPAVAPPSPRIALATPKLSHDPADPLPSTSPGGQFGRPPKGLNVGELLARAAGYREGLRTVESTLLEKDLSIEDFAELLGELDELLLRRSDLLLYEPLLSADERRLLVESLSFPQTAVAAIGTRIAKARELVADPGALEAVERNRRLSSLDALSMRLSKMHP